MPVCGAETSDGSECQIEVSGDKQNCHLHGDSDGSESSEPDVETEDDRVDSDPEPDKSQDSEDSETDYVPEKDAPSGETMFTTSESELITHGSESTEGDNHEPGNSGDGEKQKDSDGSGDSGISPGNSFGVEEAAMFHMGLNGLMATVGGFLGLDIPRFGEKQLAKIAKRSAPALGMLIPDGYIEETKTGSGAINALEPHINALLIGLKAGSESSSGSDKSDSEGSKTSENSESGDIDDNYLSD